MRDQSKEFQPLYGVTPVNAIAHIDSYIGPFNSSREAFNSVPETMRVVGKPVDIYTDETQSKVRPFTWSKDRNKWVLLATSTETGTKVVSIGSITVASDHVLVNAGPDGNISVMFDWITYTVPGGIQLPITPVSQDKIKVVVIYALPDEDQLIYIAEGQEGIETVEPALPPNALFIRRGIVTSEGTSFDPDRDLVGYKKVIEDNWLRTALNRGSSNITADKEVNNFYIFKSVGMVTGSNINTITFPEEITYAREFIIYNNLIGDITFNPSTTNGLVKGFNIPESVVLKPKNSLTVKYNPTSNNLEIIIKPGITNVTTNEDFAGNGSVESPLQLSQATLDNINSRLSKTTTSITAPDSTYKWVYVTDDDNVTRRMLATDLGKNIANSYLTSLPNTGLKLGAIWELDSNGFPLRFKNLPAKDTDPTLQKKMVVLPDGTVGLRDLNDVTVNIPEQFSSTASVVSTTITVNHIYPNPVPPPPDYGDQLNAVMIQYKDLIFTPITGTDVDIITPNNLSLDVNKYEPQSKLFQLRISQEILDSGVTYEVKVVPKNYILPQDKNWVVRFVLNGVWTDKETLSRMIQLVQSDNFPRQFIDFFGGDGWGAKKHIVLPSGQMLENVDTNSTMVLFVKVGNVINIQVYSGSRCIFESVSATQELGNYKPCLRLLSGTPNAYFKSLISYSILP